MNWLITADEADHVVQGFAVAGDRFAGPQYAPALAKHVRGLRSVLDVLPALQTPTVSELSNPDWVDVDTIIDEKVVRDLIPKLKKAGAKGLVEYPLNKVIF